MQVNNLRSGGISVLVQFDVERDRVAGYLKRIPLIEGTVAGSICISSIDPIYKRNIKEPVIVCCSHRIILISPEIKVNLAI